MLSKANNLTKVLLLFIGSFFLCAQETNLKKTDSILEVIRNSESKETKLLGFERLFHLSKRYDKPKALNYLLEKKKILDSLNDKPKLAKLNARIGWFITNDLELPDKGKEYLERALTLSEQLNDSTLIALSNTYMGFMYMRKNYFKTALEYYLTSANINEKIKNYPDLAFDYNLMARVYESQNMYSNSLGYHHKALALRKKYTNRRHVSHSLTNIGETHIKARQYDSAIVYFYMAKKIADSINHIERQIRISNGLAQCHYEMKSLDSSYFYFKKSLGITNRLEIDFSRATSYIGLSKLFLKQQLLDSSFYYASKSIDLLKNHRYYDQLKDTYSVLTEIERERQNHEKALEYYHLYNVIKDSIASNNIKATIAELEIQFETNTKERELEKKNLELQKKESNQKLLTWILLGSGLLIALGAYAFLKIRKKNKLLDKQKVLLEKTVDEKSVLLKEVHHRVKNSFQIVSSLLFLQSKNVKDKEAQLAIKEAQNRVRSMVLIHRKLYSKDDLKGIDTQEYFEELTQDIFASHQDKSKGLQYDLDIEPMILDIETITPIGLILNELIVNVLKHAYDTFDEKSKMQISFNSIKDNQLQLKVIDNGKGFSEPESQSSFGLKLIKALAKKLKAELVFNSKEGLGTEAILNITKFEVL